MIGRLRRRVVIEERTRTPDAGGGAVETWSPRATVWAWVKPIDGSERVSAEQRQSGARYDITIRYRTDVSLAHRMRLDGVPLSIHAIKDPNDHRHWLVLTCHAGEEGA